MITSGPTRRDLRSHLTSSLLNSDPSQLPGGSLGISGLEAANKRQDSVRITELQKYEVKISIVIRVKVLWAKGVNPSRNPEIEIGLLSRGAN